MRTSVSYTTMGVSGRISPNHTVTSRCISYKNIFYLKSTSELLLFKMIIFSENKDYHVLLYANITLHFRLSGSTFEKEKDRVLGNSLLKKEMHIL